MLKFIDDSILFFTLSLDPKGAINVLNTYFPSIKEEIEYELNLSETGLDILKGDFVFSMLDENSYIMTFSINNPNRFLNLLKNDGNYYSIQRLGNNSYFIEYSGVNIYLDEDIFSIFDSSLDYYDVSRIINNLNDNLSERNLKFFMNNSMTFYINAENLYRVLKNEYNEYHDIIKELKYISGSANIKNNKIESSFRIDFKYGTEELLIKVFNSLMDSL